MQMHEYNVKTLSNCMPRRPVIRILFIFFYIVSNYIANCSKLTMDSKNTLATRELVCELCRHFFLLGWVTGTGGSISIRDGNKIFMTPSGVQKERINPDEIFELNMEGDVTATPDSKPGFTPKLSDCSPLFMHAFKQRNAGAVLHSHGKYCNLITNLFGGKSEFRLSHQEMIKGIKGFGYRDELVIPIIENTAHEHELADSLGEAIAAFPKACAVLVRRHGMYVWGDTWEQAKRHGECLHYLFEVVVSMKSLGLDYTLPAVTATPPYAGIIIPKAKFNDLPLYNTIKGTNEELKIRDLVCELCRQFYNSGWVTGTGGSISIRHGEAIFMTPSGVQKERIKPDELYVVDRNSNILLEPTPKHNFTPKLSDCSPLFLHAYQQRNAGAVLHSHAICCNLITSLYEGKSEFRLSHQEMIKGIKGFGYRDELVIPIIENTAHEHELADSLGEAIAAYPKACAVLVRRHGMYVWGDTWEQAKRHGECLHYLFDVCISMRQNGMDFTIPAITASGVYDDETFASTTNATTTTTSGQKRTLENGTNGHEPVSKKGHTNGHVNGHHKYSYYVFDIEGTTTPISFVKDVLFPYAANHVKEFLEQTWSEKETQEDIKALYQQIQLDHQDKSLPPYIHEYPLPTETILHGSKEIQIEWLVNYVHFNIKHDRKISSLKALQGHIWRRGYQSNAIKSIIFDDILTTFQKIISSGNKIAIYSSGSREAQKLLFKYSNHGDLSQYISCYFDTSIGNKREAHSYEEIKLSLGADHASDILFITDIIEEADAAKAAGLHAAVSIRPGNGVISKKHDFQELHTFENIV